MLFSDYIRESEEEETEVQDDIDLVADDYDPDSAEFIQAVANDVENYMMTSAMEAVSYFDGGKQAVQNFTESTELQTLVEMRKIPKKTFVRLNKNDDLHRRSRLACLIIAKKNHDPLWEKLAQNRVKEKKLRNAIYAKYGNKANIIARKSQIQHDKMARKLPSLPKVQF